MMSAAAVLSRIGLGGGGGGGAAAAVLAASDGQNEVSLKPWSTNLLVLLVLVRFRPRPPRLRVLVSRERSEMGQRPSRMWYLVSSRDPPYREWTVFHRRGLLLPRTRATAAGAMTRPCMVPRPPSQCRRYPCLF